MSEVVKKRDFSFENPRFRWELEFVRTSKVEGGHAWSWVQKGIDLGVVQNTNRERRALARDMGTVFAYAFIQETGAQLPAEKLEPEKIALETKMTVDRVYDVRSVMVEAGILRSVKGQGKNPNFI